LLQVFRHCSSISSAINLSLTSRRYYYLLRTSQKIPVLFGIAERVWGPLKDIYQILTYNSAQPVQVKRTPNLSLALLVQVSRIGRVAALYEEHYPQLRWNGDRALFRRTLTPHEAYTLRRAVYRTWLYSIAFHHSAAPRTMRMMPALVSDHCQLLRLWSTTELIEIEDLRGILESMIIDLCPSDGEVFWRRGGEPAGKQHSWNKGPRAALDSNLFHHARADSLLTEANKRPAAEAREQTMVGWGDEIEQYHVLNDLLKLTPMQIMQLYMSARTKEDVLGFIDERTGSPWFWNNGESMLHAWILVMHGRGVPVQELREKVFCGMAGIAVDSEHTGNTEVIF
jgi:hypothetical protein